MNADLIAKNLALYSAQVAILIAVCGAVIYALRLHAPKPRLIFWHIVLAICVALPFIEPWRAPGIASDASVTTSTVVLGPGTAANSGAINIPWVVIVLGVVALGAIARLAWLAFGLLRLQRFRRVAEALYPLPELIAESCARPCVFPEILLSEDVVSPVTFGIRRPTVLLPRGFLDLALGAQQAIVCHEALHVRRKDWGFTVAEEIVRALLWFHPAVWWLLGQLQLAREQAVDSAVVEHTRCRDEYLSALLAIASGRYQADLATAMLFLKKRHLKERVAVMVKGAAMSKFRVVASMIAALSMLPLSVALIAWQLPLTAAPQVVGAPDAPGVEVVTGPCKLLHRTGVEYPSEAFRSGAGGDVVLSVSVNNNGDVTDARVVSGPEVFRKPALNSVLNWHFATDPPPPPNFEITIRFPAPKVRTAGNAIPHGSGLSGPPPGAVKSLTVTKIDLSQVPSTLRSAVEQALTVHEGDVIDWSRLQQQEAALHGIDEHLVMAGPISDDKYVALRVFLQSPGAGNPAAASDSGLKPIRVDNQVQSHNLVKKVTPVYPPEAKQAKVQGNVQFKAVIGKDGRIKELTLLSGDPLLAPAATEAVKQWVYKPTLLNGDPVDVITEININFTLLP